ncbi:MAG: sigma-54 dependent transcriptional regulator [Spirochaetota bacterium]
MIRVLIIDDELQLTEAFKTQLNKEGMDVSACPSAAEAIAIMKKQRFDVAVLDIKLPDINGVEFLLKLKKTEPDMEVIMLTGFASVDTAIRSMKLGAYDYLTKPCKISELHKVILKAYEKKSLQEKNIVLKEHIQRIGHHDDFIGESKEIKKIKKLISLVADSNMPVLILGETGTGKELTARAIHEQSKRAGNPFVAINAASLQESILESELFGYKKGAFTGAQNNKLGLLEIANNGTLFVDEVGDMGLAIQSKMLRVVETGTFMKLGDTKEIKVNIRFIFATNKELESEIESGKFRKDLFFRMNAFVINLPPLREKKKDIPYLANYFLEKFSGGGKRKSFSSDALKLLTSYDWPGNVRELANVIERSVLLSAKRDEILISDFPEGMLKPSPKAEESKRVKIKNDIMKLTNLEQDHIKKVLDSVGGNKSKAASLLGITRKTLYSKIGKNIK